MVLHGFDERQTDALVRIADSLDGLLSLYKAHLRLTAKSALMSMGPLGPSPEIEHIKDVLRELEWVAKP
jgi:hypothetical protein